MTEPDNQPETADRPAPAGQPAEPAIAGPAPGIGRARIALRVSMVVMAVAMIAFAYFAPVWVDRGVTQVNRDRLQSIAEETAHNIAANGWTAAQGVAFAQRQAKLGTIDTTVDIRNTAATVTVTITGTANSANPFAALTGGDTVNRIAVTYSTQK